MLCGVQLAKGFALDIPHITLVQADTAMAYGVDFRSGGRHERLLRTS
jgi:hypothetical protein